MIIFKNNIKVLYKKYKLYFYKSISYALLLILISENKKGDSPDIVIKHYHSENNPDFNSTPGFYSNSYHIEYCL